MTEKADSKFPLQYEDGLDYCIVKDANGRDFAMTVQPELMKEMERALREDIARLSRPPAQSCRASQDLETLASEIETHISNNSSSDLTTLHLKARTAQGWWRLLKAIRSQTLSAA